jgi:hypothetical protein
MSLGYALDRLTLIACIPERTSAGIDLGQCSRWSVRRFSCWFLLSLEDHVKLQSAAIAICATLLLTVTASAQGIVGGAQEGASKGAREGNRAAGPIGGAVGTVVGGTAGAVTGGVKGAVGAPTTTKKKKKVE